MQSGERMGSGGVPRCRADGVHSLPGYVEAGGVCFSFTRSKPAHALLAYKL